MTSNPFFLGTAVAVLGAVSLTLVFVLITKARKPLHLSASTERLLDEDYGLVVESLLSSCHKISAMDLLSIYWNSRVMLTEAHLMWLEKPDDLVTITLQSMQEKAHGETRKRIRIHIWERLQRNNKTLLYSLLLLESYSQQVTILGEMRQRLGKSSPTEAI